MRKLNLTQQIVLLIFLILMLSSGVFSGLVLVQNRAFAEAEMYSRLETLLTVSAPDDESSLDLPTTEIYLISMEGDVRTGVYRVSANYVDYFTQENCNEIVNVVFEKAKTIRDKAISDQCEYSLNNTSFYYVYQLEKDGHFSLMLTDSTYINKTIRNVTRQTFLIFLSIMCIACFVMSLWSKGVVQRIRKIQRQIINIPTQTNIEVSYDDDGADEIAELGRTVEEMRKEINTNEITKNEMLQNISHDLKTPIAVIKSYSESLLDGISDISDAEIILNQANLLRNKVNKLLQYNRLEYLSKDTDYEMVNMKEVIEEVARSYKYQTELNIILDLEEIYFKGYRDNYYTVIDNIVDNAKRYAKTTIKIILRETEIIIYNDGEHIEEQFKNAVFKPYEKGSKGQFGLGMSIVKKTLEFFDLKLEVRNENIGVSFIIKK